MMRLLLFEFLFYTQESFITSLVKFNDVIINNSCSACVFWGVMNRNMAIVNLIENGVVGLVQS